MVGMTGFQQFFGSNNKQNLTTLSLIIKNCHNLWPKQKIRSRLTAADFLNKCILSLT